MRLQAVLEHAPEPRLPLLGAAACESTALFELVAAAHDDRPDLVEAAIFERAHGHDRRRIAARRRAQKPERAAEFGCRALGATGIVAVGLGDRQAVGELHDSA